MGMKSVELRNWRKIYSLQRFLAIPCSSFTLSAGGDLLANCYEAHDRNQATQPEVRVELKGWLATWWWESPVEDEEGQEGCELEEAQQPPQLPEPEVGVQEEAEAGAGPGGGVLPATRGVRGEVWTLQTIIIIMITVMI